MVLEVRCTGAPYEIGLKHGDAAKSQVHGSIAFYKSLFQRVAGLSWPEVHTEALKFMPLLNQDEWIPYVQEMRGVADGAGVSFEDVLALNVRTEIAYGMFKDGCTALSWKEEERSFLAQNWDV
jgi:isopenicillin-N N-acyltransferase like protein